MNNLKVMMNGIIRENPTFVLLLGMCPTLGTTSSAINGMGMGLATMFVLICSNVVISSVKKLIPDMVRIPSFIVVIASFVTLLQMIMQAYVPELYATLGLFIPLIVVNCIVLGRAEAFAAKNNPLSSMFDGIGMGARLHVRADVTGSRARVSGNRQNFQSGDSARRVRHAAVCTGSGRVHRTGIPHRGDQQPEKSLNVIDNSIIRNSLWNIY